MGDIAAISLGIKMAIQQYPGYGLICRLRDGEGLEEIFADKLRVFANWLSPPSETNQDLEQIRKSLGASEKNTVSEFGFPTPAEVITITRPRIIEPSQQEQPTAIEPEVEKTLDPARLIGVRYIGEKEGEMRLFIKPTRKWIEFSALAPELDLKKEEVDWLLAHRRDFIRRQ